MKTKAVKVAGPRAFPEIGNCFYSRDKVLTTPRLRVKYTARAGRDLAAWLSFWEAEQLPELKPLTSKVRRILSK